MAGFDYDVLIIGSGFGGSVAALRAAEKGYRVGVMESGRRWNDEDILKTQWDLPGFLWFPAAELYGIQRIEYLDDLLVLCGAGVGGGSHVYASALYVPPRKFFDAPEWAGITDWAGELAPYLDQASRMLGVVRYPYLPTDVDRYMHQVAIEMGRGWSMSWTTLPDVYSIGLPHLDEWAATVDVAQPDKATEAFFPTIARYGRSSNLFLEGTEADLFFDDEESNDALIELRRFVIDFVETHEPDNPQIWPWERNIEL